MMSEQEKTSRSSLHGFIKKMMDEIDKCNPCVLCGKEKAIGINFVGDKEYICVDCLVILVNNVDEIDDKVSKAVNKARQK